MDMEKQEEIEEEIYIINDMIDVIIELLEEKGVLKEEEFESRLKKKLEELYIAKGGLKKWKDIKK